MGHERTGILPRSKVWRNVVADIADVPANTDLIGDVAAQVIKNVKNKLVRVENDNGVQAAFQYLVFLAHSAKQEDPSDYFEKLEIPVSDINSLLQIAQSLDQWIEEHKESNEYASVAKGAALDAIGEWKKNHTTNQTSLFSEEKTNVWAKAANGAGFCELSRLFFSNFTERYLKYFLEREASSSLSNIADRNAFSSNLESHIQDVSQHAFETSKITQSFAAGWFNKNVKADLPTQRQIEGFLHLAFGKMRDELLREEKKSSKDE